jgi:hypothetical protein
MAGIAAHLARNLRIPHYKIIICPGSVILRHEGATRNTGDGSEVDSWDASPPEIGAVALTWRAIAPPITDQVCSRRREPAGFGEDRRSIAGKEWRI